MLRLLTYYYFIGFHSYFSYAIDYYRHYDYISFDIFITAFIFFIDNIRHTLYYDISFLHIDFLSLPAFISSFIGIFFVDIIILASLYYYFHFDAIFFDTTDGFEAIIFATSLSFALTLLFSLMLYFSFSPCFRCRHAAAIIISPLSISFWYWYFFIFFIDAVVIIFDYLLPFFDIIIFAYFSLLVSLIRYAFIFRILLDRCIILIAFAISRFSRILTYYWYDYRLMSLVSLVFASFTKSFTHFRLIFSTGHDRRHFLQSADIISFTLLTLHYELINITGIHCRLAGQYCIDVIFISHISCCYWYYWLFSLLMFHYASITLLISLILLTFLHID